jgi:hypothetical protein
MLDFFLSVYGFILNLNTLAQNAYRYILSGMLMANVQVTDKGAALGFKYVQYSIRKIDYEFHASLDVLVRAGSIEKY